MDLFTRPQTIAVAGASGFVGRHLCRSLAEAGHRVVALSRSGRAPVDHPAVEGRACDLFSLLDLERALAGAEQAVYLVHSMLPSARLTQASFADLDLLLADNFARACQTHGVRHIVYLGGLLPAGSGRSAHLASREEVEGGLAAHGATVTTLRAGLVVGPGGSSFEMVTALARRLPLMVCPSWTRTLTQPVALDDVVALITAVVRHPEVWGQAWDIGGPDVLTYQDILVRTGALLGRRIRVLPAPFVSPRLSVLWVCAVTGAPRALVAPLVQSLTHPMVCRDRALQERLGIPGRSFAEALARAVVRAPRLPPARERRAPAQRKPSVVRSVQRLPVPPGRDAAWMAEEYMRWLPRAMAPLLAVEVRDGRVVQFRLRGTGTLLLELTYAPHRSTPRRVLLYLTGGRLAATARTRGRLEFRLNPDQATALAAIHDFEPSLPWPIYTLTQAPAHLWVMRRFARHLAALGPAAPAAIAAPAPERPARPVVSDLGGGGGGGGAVVSDLDH